ncbi:SSPO protein, partial [Hemiprocne comata]|nr:SSPO protein [Hemiprocne comata]
QVRGLCGTFTWRQEDEFSTPAGDVAPGVATFASTYRVGGACPPPLPLQPCGDGAGSTHMDMDMAGATCALLHGPAFQ